MMRLGRAAPPAFSLDFVARRRRPSWMGWAILLSAALVALGVTLEYLDEQERRDEAQAQLARAERLAARVRGERQTHRQDRTLDTRLHRVAQLAAGLQRPWLQVLPQLEAAINADVALLSLDADSAKAQLTLAGEARTLEAVFAYAQRIGAVSGFDSVQVLNYEFRNPPAGPETVSFRLSARWQGGA